MRKSGVKAHAGRIFGIVVEKHPGLPIGHPDRKFKGRLVFQGNEVTDETAHYAIFSELSSSPATLEASKNVDAYSLFPGHALQKADGEQAYIQAPWEESKEGPRPGPDSHGKCGQSTSRVSVTLSCRS